MESAARDDMQAAKDKLMVQTPQSQKNVFKSPPPPVQAEP